jgi:hypothetical protein
MRELNFQKRIIDLIKEEGGYGYKMSNRFKVGVPDLLIAAPMRGVVFFECKCLNVMPDAFDRQTGITPIQMDHLNRLNSTQEHPVGCQLVYLIHRGEERAVVWPGHWDRITSDYEKDETIWEGRKAGSKSRWNVMKLVEAVRLTRSGPYSSSEAKRTETSTNKLI